MTTLSIRDLPQMKELDQATLSATTGGYLRLPILCCYPRPRLPRPSYTNNVDFGSQNSFVGNTAGVNEGSQSVGTINL